MTFPPPPPYVEGHNLLAGKTVLVTAAAGTGIGFAVAKRCQEEGARLVIADKHERRLAESAAELGVLGVPCDVTQEADVQNLFAAAAEELGGIDVLINNAGLGGTAQLHEMTDEQWSIVLDVTLNGTFRCTRAALNHMYERGHGVIVNNASVIGWRGQEGQAHYAAAKAGVMALTRCAAIEGGPSRRAGERGRAEPRDARQPRQGHHRGAAHRARGQGGVRALGRAVGGRQRDGVPRLRLLRVHDRRDGERQQPAPLTHPPPLTQVSVDGGYVPTQLTLARGTNAQVFAASRKGGLSPPPWATRLAPVT